MAPVHHTTPAATRPLSNLRGMNRLASVSARSPLLPSSKFSRFALALACLLTGLLILLVKGARESGRLASDLLQSALAVLAGISAIRVTRASKGHLRRLWLLFTVSVFLVCAEQILKTYYK